MRVDPSKSAHHEAHDVRDIFTPQEIRHARVLLRRLRFLESQIRETGGIAANASGGAVFAEVEAAALEWVLGPEGINFLAEPTPHVPTPR